MPQQHGQDVRTEAEGQEIARLRREVRLLRDQIGARANAETPTRPARAAVRITAIGLGVMLAASAVALLAMPDGAIGLPRARDWAAVAGELPTQAAVDLVERIFTRY